MKSKLIKGLICLIVVSLVFSVSIIMVTNKGVEQNKNDFDKRETVAIATTEKIEETTKHIEETKIITENKEETTMMLIEETSSKSIPEATSKIIETQVSEKTEVQETEYIKSNSDTALYSASQFRNMGVIYWGNWKWTYYSENILPGYGLSIPGRHNDENGYICDENDYICLASSSLSKGVVIDTPFGKQGKIYDCGCAYDTIDVYTSW